VSRSGNSKAARALQGCGAIQEEAEDIYLQHMNIKVNEICNISKISFGKYVYCLGIHLSTF
jgi:hypothetical protein